MIYSRKIKWKLLLSITRKRIPKDSFRNWYKSQSRYRTKEDREKDALLEDATITMEQRDLERSMQ